MGVRFILLNAVFIGLYTLLGFNLYNVQVQDSDYYVKKAEAQTAYTEASKFRRGEIRLTDRSGNTVPAVINKDYPLVYANPSEVTDPAAVAARLTERFGGDRAALQKKLEDRSLRYVLIKRKASPEETAWVDEAVLKGVSVGEERERFYPFAALAAQTLGFVGVNEDVSQPTGIYGLEKLYNPTLSRGESLQTTIDRTVQAEAEETLKELCATYHATGAALVVEEAKTGKILTLAEYPSFDPNDYGAYPVERFGSPVVQALYEPGSVFKPLTMAAGIDAGVLTPQTTYVDKGSVTLNGETIHNWDHKAYGEITMTNVIEHSVNTGAVFAARQIGRKTLLHYFEKFGFDKETGVDIPHEASGNLVNLSRSDSRDIDLGSAGFGQGIAVTPIELISAYGALANGGELMRPYLNEALKPDTVRRVVSEETASEVLGMMESAVEKAGVAYIRGYRIAGKTGTAQVPDLVRGGYSDDYIHTFVGIFPVSAPRFVVLIKLDKPDTTLAGLTVVPAFRSFAQFMINYYNIPPDNLPNER